MTMRSRQNVGAWAAAGATLSAILSSACCWIPLLLLSFGASAAGVSAGFEEYRALLFVLTGSLLVTGFYLVYFRKPRCAPSGACSVPDPKLVRFTKGMLWVATLLALSFAFFPSYAGAIAGEPSRASAEGADCCVPQVEKDTVPDTP